MTKLQVLCGMIASGKSSYTQNAANKNYICINDDAIVNLVHANQYHLYDKNLKTLYKSIENHIITMSVALQRTIIADRGLNVSQNSRRRFIAIANSLDLPCEAILFKNEGPAVHAHRRYQSDSRGHDLEYWLRVANFHNNRWQTPTLEEGFSAIHEITFDEIKNGKVL